MFWSFKGYIVFKEHVLEVIGLNVRTFIRGVRVRCYRTCIRGVRVRVVGGPGGLDSEFLRDQSSSNNKVKRTGARLPPPLQTQEEEEGQFC